jgi:hypothetical protein
MNMVLARLSAADYGRNRGRGERAVVPQRQDPQLVAIGRIARTGVCDQSFRANELTHLPRRHL